MSTIYDFNEEDYILAIETHYFNDGWDVAGFSFDGESEGNVFISESEDTFDDVENVEDVFVGSEFTHIVVKTENADDTVDLEVFTMFTSEFKANWSEQIWGKFRMDSYTHICPECGKKMAHSVAGQTLSDIGRIEQFHCDGCHYTWIGHPSGKFIREGVLHSSWDVR